MKKSKKLPYGKILNSLVGAAALALVGYLVWNFFDVGTRIRIHTAIGDLVHRRQTEKARTALENSGNREMALEAIKAELAEDDPSVWGKIELLQMLARLKENRPLERALDSKAKATQRAAAYFWHNDPDKKQWCGDIAVAWVADMKADARDIAAMICGRLKREEAAPSLLQLLDVDTKNADNAPIIRQALAALAELKAPGLAARAMSLARSPDVEMTIRGQAFDIVGRLEDAPHAEIQALMIAIAKDGTAQSFLRNKALLVLGGKDYANETTWEALLTVFHDAALTESAGITGSRRFENWVLQRNALASLGRNYPLDRLEQLLLDRRAYNHPYYAIRVDVATSLAVLRVRKRLALEILCSFLVDEDSADTQRLVRQEGWLSLWQLTGTAYGVPDPQKFPAPSPGITGEAYVRQFLFYADRSRYGVTPDQVKLVKGFTGDLAQMKKIRQVYESKFADFEANWKAQDEAQPPAPPPDDEKKGTEEVAPQGPMPPPPGDDQGSGDGDGCGCDSGDH